MSDMEHDLFLLLDKSDGYMSSSVPHETARHDPHLVHDRGWRLVAAMLVLRVAHVLPLP